jgi:hypothetical protein
MNRDYPLAESPDPGIRKDTTKPVLQKFKRAIGDTAVQMEKAKKLGLTESSSDLKSRLAEKIKAKKQ